MKKLYKIISLIICLVLFFTNFTNNVLALGEVASIGTTNYQTVQQAIDASSDGDIITLNTDVIESVSITNKTLTIDLAGHLFQAPDKKRALLATNSNLTIIDSNPDLVHENIPTSYPEEWGVSYKTINGGVFCGFAGLDTNNKNISGCVNVSGGTFTMIGGSFYGNHTLSNGGALVLSGNIQASLTEVNFYGNIGQSHGGGIFCTGEETIVNVKDCLFDGNIAWRGGGIKAEEMDSISIKDSTFINNVSWQTGGGIHVDATNDVKILDCDYHDNEATGNGGGIYTHTVDKLTIDNVMCNNNESGNNGGGFFCWGNYTTSDFTITNSTFNNNSTAVSGGGLVFQNANVIFKNNEVNNNSCGTNGGGLAVWAMAWEDDGTIQIENCEFKNNEALNFGGGLFIKNSQGTNCTTYIKNSLIEGNYAKSTGGGIFTNPTITLVVDDNTEIINNTADSVGGGIAAVSADTILNKCLIKGNESKGNAGGIAVQNGLLNLNEGCVVTENISNSGGGGITGYKTSVINLNDGSKVYNNTATAAGADLAIYNNADTYLNLNEAADFNEKFQNTGIKIDGWYLDNSGSRYSQETATEETRRDFNGGLITIIAAIGKDARLYKVTYESLPDEIYGLPEGFTNPVDLNKYNKNDLVIVLEKPTTTCNFAMVDGEKVLGKWEFVSWNKTNFNIVEDTNISGLWKFTEGDPNVPPTGDDSNIALYIGIMSVSLVGFVTLILLKKKDRRTS